MLRSMLVISYRRVGWGGVRGGGSSSMAWVGLDAVLFVLHLHMITCYEVSNVIFRNKVSIDFILKNIERHTAYTIVSWPNPKQWVIVHTSDLIMIINKAYISSQSSQMKWINWKHTAPYIVYWITERICLILLTHSTNYIWQAFYKFNVFR